MAGQLAEMGRVSQQLERYQQILATGQMPDESTPEGKKMREELAALNARVAEMMPKAFSVLHEIPRLEKSPQKAGRFYASFLSKIEGMDEKTRDAIEQRATEWVRDMQKSSLAFPQRPKGDERKDWDVRRARAMSEFLTQIQVEVPGAKMKIIKSEDLLFDPTDDHTLFEMLFDGDTE
jgi:hypothetical protein